jgi:hypothetical protein
VVLAPDRRLLAHRVDLMGSCSGTDHPDLGAARRRVGAPLESRHIDGNASAGSEPAGTAWNSRTGMVDRLVNHLLSVGWLLASCRSRTDVADAARLDAAIDGQGC